LSPEVQARYAAVEVDRSDIDWMHVTEQAGTGGFVPLYVRYQRARLGELCVGDDAPDCSLATLDAQPTTLLNHTKAAEEEDMPRCLMAGSYS